MLNTPSLTPSIPYHFKPNNHLATIRCPACLHQGYEITGGQFQGCGNCGTVAARNRKTTAKYDAIYVASRYERYSTTNAMSELRLDLIHHLLSLYEGVGSDIGYRYGRLLDVGYGNGAFIRAAKNDCWDAYGNDVNPTPYEGVRQVDLPNLPEWPVRYRVITFFDCLEHFEDLMEARWVSHHTDWLVLSFPQMPPNFPYEHKDWKHVRAGEHHLFFTPQSLAVIFSHGGVKAELVYQGNPEDSIRGKLPGGLPNICTAALRCRKEKN